MRIKSAFFLPLATAAILLTACGQEEPANKAVADASHALDMIRPEAVQYAPTEMSTADATLAHMKQNLAAKKYSDVLKEIPRSMRTTRRPVKPWFPCAPRRRPPKPNGRR